MLVASPQSWHRTSFRHHVLLERGLAGIDVGNDHDLNAFWWLGGLLVSSIRTLLLSVLGAKFWVALVKVPSDTGPSTTAATFLAWLLVRAGRVSRRYFFVRPPPFRW